MNAEPALGFPAFPAHRGRRGTRGQSWWGRSWVQAMEDTSLDSDQLLKGRRYANSGQVGPITISPGRIAAVVQGPHDSYEAVVLVDQLSAVDWGRFLDEIAARAGHLAALLDGDMPHDLVDAAGAAGVPLLPGIGDLDPSCTCDAWELPCQHAAALCYQVAWLLDENPFILLLMRGRGQEALLDELQHRMTAAARGCDERPTVGASVSGGSAVGAGVADGREFAPARAAEAFAAQQVGLPDLPAMPPPLTIEAVAVAGAVPPPGLGPTGLSLLVLDAAHRARGILAALLAGESLPVPLDEWQDAVRLAAAHPELSERLADATGRSDSSGGADLPVAVQAWSYGGASALEVLEHTWTPSGSEPARARAELLAAWDDDAMQIEMTANRLTLTAGGETRQLRLDRLGRWHPYERAGADWLPAGPPDRDPVGLLTALDS